VRLPGLGRLRRPGRRARRLIAGASVIAVVGVGYAAYAASADSTSYRTASATIGDVEQTLDVSGSVEPAGRADLAFATAGTVETITVTAGDTVSAGTVLGTLDATGLRKELQQARSTLAKARAQLESDQDVQAETVTAAAASSSGTPSSPSAPSQDDSVGSGATGAGSGDSGSGSNGSGANGSGSTGSGPSGSSDLSAALAALAQQQEAVTAAQSTVSASLTSAREALAAQQEACADAFAGDSVSEGDDGGGDDGGGGSAEGSAADQACADALSAVQAAQEDVSTDQDALQSALESLGDTLTTAVSTLQSSGSGSETGAETGSGSGSGPGSGNESSGNESSGGQPGGNQSGSNQSGSSGAGSSSTPTGSTSSAGSAGGRSVSAATLAQDQAAIDAAKVDVVEAQQALRTATITAPFGGRVVAVEVAEGHSVSSGTSVFTLVSPGTTTVAVAATSGQIRQLEVGQAATATPAGSDTPLAGTVTQISTVPDSSASYPVTITLEEKDLDIATGLSASVSVVVGAADEVVTVPASAVGDGTVSIVGADGVATQTRVTTGVVGATTVEIVEGVEAGDDVVLADLDRALPTTDESSQSGFEGGGLSRGGGFGAGTGGPPGGGFPGR